MQVFILVDVFIGQFYVGWNGYQSEILSDLSERVYHWVKEVGTLQQG